MLPLKARNWLYDRFLPWVTREEYQKELNALRAQNKALAQECKELRAYIQGVQDIIRHRPKFEIYEGKNEKN